MLGCDGAKQLTPARAGSRRLARKRPADSPRSLCGGGFGLWSTCELIGTFPELFAKDRHDGLVGFSSVSKTFHEGQSKGSKHVKTCSKEYLGLNLKYGCGMSFRCPSWRTATWRGSQSRPLRPDFQDIPPLTVNTMTPNPYENWVTRRH